MTTDIQTDPPCELDPDERYSVIDGGKLVYSGSCIHVARGEARSRRAQLWRKGSRQFPDMLVQDYSGKEK